MTHFRAPWSKSLIVASIFATLVCFGVTYGMWTLPMDRSLQPLRFGLGLLPLAVILVCGLFMVRGYSIANDTLLVHRPFWKTQVSLRELRCPAWRSPLNVITGTPIHNASQVVVV